MNTANRRSIRYTGYDYSQKGWYFITMVGTTTMVGATLVVALSDRAGIKPNRAGIKPAPTVGLGDVVWG